MKNNRGWKLTIGCGIPLLAALIIVAFIVNYIVNFQVPSDALTYGIGLFFIVIPLGVVALGVLGACLPIYIRIITKWISEE